MMCMKHWYLLLFTAAIILIVYSGEVDESRRRSHSRRRAVQTSRRRSSSKGSGEVDASRRRSHSRRRAVQTSRRRSSSKGSGSSSNKPPKNNPYKPIKATTYRSPIIQKQAKSRSSFNRVLTGSTDPYFHLSSAPMYRGYYPMFYRSQVRIPDNRAVRVWKEETMVTDSYGKTCFDPAVVSGYNYKSNNDKYFTKSKITMDYGNRKDAGSENVTLDASRTGDNVTITSESDYSKPIIPGTNCTRVTVTTTVTLIEMYPNGSGEVQGSTAAAFLIPLLLELVRHWR